MLLKQILSEPRKSWVVIDEIQRVPSLLNTVHRTFNEHADSLKFILSGSSARKIRKQNTNLLAGRALHRKFFPIVGQELGYDFDTESILKYGTLPQVGFHWNDLVIS